MNYPPCDTCQAYIGEDQPPGCELGHYTDGPCDACAEHVSWAKLERFRAAHVAAAFIRAAGEE